MTATHLALIQPRSSCEDAATMPRPASADIAALAHAHGRLVFAAAYRVLGDAALAEDVQQDVFLRLLEADTDGVRSWPAYLSAAATRLAIDHVRRQQRWRRLVPAWLLQAQQSEPGADAASLDAERATRLRHALSRLKPREAECFALRFVQDMDIPTIAAALALTANHVSVLLHRATRALELQLRETPTPETTP